MIILLFVLAFGAITFFWGVVWFWKGIQRIHHASNTPTSKIRSAAQGYVELHGVTALPQGQSPLISPLSYTPCLWWNYEIYTYVQRGENESKETIESAESTDWFCMDDGSGRCWVNPHQATITEHFCKKWDAVLRKDRINAPGGRPMWQGRRYYYVEKMLLPQHKLYALGHFQSKNGNHILSAPQDGKPFILSNEDENEFIVKSRWMVALGIACCLFGAGIMMFMLLSLLF